MGTNGKGATAVLKRTTTIWNNADDHAETTIARSLHDIGLAAWFGGSLMGAVGVNGAAQEVDDPSQRLRVMNAGWGRWTPANLLAIGAYSAGAAMLMRDNWNRMKAQKGVVGASVAKSALTVAAMGATAYSRALGQKVMNAEAQGPNGEMRQDVLEAERKLAMLQWVIPALTGGILALGAKMGEQQRPNQVVRGMLGRLKQIKR